MARSAISRYFSRITPVLMGAGLLSLGALGCASQEDLTALQMENANLNEQLATANSEAARNRALVESLKEQLAKVAGEGDIDQARYLNLQQQIAALTSERDALMAKYEGMIARLGESELPPPLINELNAWVAANPDLVEFDSKLGIVKFKSDVTFASGDAELTSEAKAVIGKFAQIINGPIASNYRLEIAGHTDNVPVESRLTKDKGHKDNWYLSSHRAISVAAALRSGGVQPNRIGVTGYADQRPVADNATPAGKQANRRVEVLILPMVVTTAAVEPAPTQAEAQPAGAPAEPAVSK